MYDKELEAEYTSTMLIIQVENSFKPYFMANLRVTKEIGRIAQISFYANNFTNSHPKMLLKSTGTYKRVNTDIYFGAELKLKF